MQLGTARKPAARNRASSQPENFEPILSHHATLPGPPAIMLMSCKRNESSTAFLSHWFTCQLPFVSRSATRASPRSSKASAASTAPRTAPLVVGPTPSRFSKASSTIFESSACDIDENPSSKSQAPKAKLHDRGFVENRAGEVKLASTFAPAVRGLLPGIRVE